MKLVVKTIIVLLCRVSGYEEFVEVFLRIIVFVNKPYKFYGSKRGINRKKLRTNTKYKTEIKIIKFYARNLKLKYNMIKQ